MFNNILVGVDGSESAIDAAHSAASIARSFGSKVLALHVFRFPVADLADVGPWGLTIEQDAMDRAAADSRGAIEQSVRRVFESLKIPIQFLHEVGFEPEVDTILRVAERDNVDLIIVGSRGLTGVSELFLGSVSSGVLHHATCPVLIVRGENTPCHTGTFRNVLLASDGSPCAQRAASYAVEMAKMAGTTLTVLNAYEDLYSVTAPGQVDAPISTSEIGIYAKQWLEYVAQPVRELAKEAGVHCTYVQEDGKPEETILKFADQHRADLIVIGSRGLRGYQRMLLGSVSNRVVHRADSPVMVVR